MRARQTSSQGIDIFVQRSSSGEWARKLIQVTPGEYRLSGEIKVAQGNGEVCADLLCVAEDAETDWQAQGIARNAGWTVGNASCRYAWLVLECSAWESWLDFEARVDQIESRSSRYHPRLEAT